MENFFAHISMAKDTLSSFLIPLGFFSVEKLAKYEHFHSVLFQQTFTEHSVYLNMEC